MIEEIKYVVVAPDGYILIHTLSNWRKGSEIIWLEVCGKNSFTWKEFYREGYRIKKCLVTIKIID